MVSKRNPVDEERVTGGELLVWGLLVALGIWLYVGGLIPAREAEASLRRQREALEVENADLRRERDRLHLQQVALQDDPELVEQLLLERGFTPEGAIWVRESDEPLDNR